jgi:hypothetical protein
MVFSLVFWIYQLFFGKEFRREFAINQQSMTSFVTAAYYARQCGYVSWIVARMAGKTSGQPTHCDFALFFCDTTRHGHASEGNCF